MRSTRFPSRPFPTSRTTRSSWSPTRPPCLPPKSSNWSPIRSSGPCWACPSSRKCVRSRSWGSRWSRSSSTIPCRCTSRASWSTNACSRLPVNCPVASSRVLGLPATAFGELYQYTLTGPMSAMELKDLHEWVIKRQLRTMPGVSEVNTWGGEVKQYQIIVDPALLDAVRPDAARCGPAGRGEQHELRRRLYRAQRRAVHAARRGPGTEHRGSRQHRSAVAATECRSCCAMWPRLAIGPAPRHGAVLRNGETVSGMVIMLKGENGKQLIAGDQRSRIAELRLPPA